MKYSKFAVSYFEFLCVLGFIMNINYSADAPEINWGSLLIVKSNLKRFTATWRSYKDEMIWFLVFLK